jgi:hypothetical protein
MKSVGLEPLAARVNVSISDPELECTVSDRIQAALRIPPLTRAPIVRARTQKRLATLDPAGKFVILRVTAANARHLPSMVDAVRPKSAGIQIVWNGHDPPRERVERHIFAVLERARATPAGPPVILSSTAELALALQILAKQKEPE